MQSICVLLLIIYENISHTTTVASLWSHLTVTHDLCNETCYLLCLWVLTLSHIIQYLFCTTKLSNSFTPLSIHITQYLYVSLDFWCYETIRSFHIHCRKRGSSLWRQDKGDTGPIRKILLLSVYGVCTPWCSTIGSSILCPEVWHRTAQLGWSTDIRVYTDGHNIAISLYLFTLVRSIHGIREVYCEHW